MTIHNLPVKTTSGTQSGRGGGDGGDGGDGMEARLAKLEAHAEHTNAGLTDLKSDMRNIRGDISGFRSDIRGDISSFRGEIDGLRGEIHSWRTFVIVVAIALMGALTAGYFGLSRQQNDLSARMTKLEVTLQHASDNIDTLTHKAH